MPRLEGFAIRHRRDSKGEAVGEPGNSKRFDLARSVSRRRDPLLRGGASAAKKVAKKAPAKKATKVAKVAH